jgi:hypothetical protein
MNETFQFTIIPQNERYYNDDSSWWIYTFTTQDDIPELIDFHFNDIFGDERRIEKGSTLVGKMQKLFLGSKYQVKAKCEFNQKYNRFPIHTCFGHSRHPEIRSGAGSVFEIAGDGTASQDAA